MKNDITSSNNSKKTVLPKNLILELTEDIGKQKKNRRKRDGFECLVGAKGFEPSTPWSQTKYSTRLSYAPKRRLL